MNAEQIGEAAQSLYKAQQECIPISPLTEQFENLTAEEAYLIQNQITRKRLEDGARIVGRKIGLTSKAMMDMLNVNEPDYGVLFDDLLFESDAVLDRSKMIQPRVEAEIAFLLKKDLDGPSVSPLQVQAATEGVIASLEIIDSPVKDWKIKLQDTIADNASCWGGVIGSGLYSPLNIDLRYVGLAVYKNGQLISTAAGAAVMGDPLKSVAWLATKLCSLGEKLRGGDIVLSGSLIGAFPIEAGDRVEAKFDRIGSVAVNII